MHDIYILFTTGAYFFLEARMCMEEEGPLPAHQALTNQYTVIGSVTPLCGDPLCPSVCRLYGLLVCRSVCLSQFPIYVYIISLTNQYKTYYEVTWYARQFMAKIIISCKLDKRERHIEAKKHTDNCMHNSVVVYQDIRQFYTTHY